MDSPFEFENADMPIDDDSENGENLHLNVSNADHVTIRKRNQSIRGKAFRFSGTFTGFTSDSSQHDQTHEFNLRVSDRILATKNDHVTLDSISYVVLSYEIARLSSSAETCDGNRVYSEHQAGIRKNTAKVDGERARVAIGTRRIVWIP